MKLLITGGTGTIGKEITILSLLKGIDVNILTRNKSLKSKKEGLYTCDKGPFRLNELQGTG